MRPSDQVRLKNDHAQQGIVVATGTRRGATSHRVAWFGSTEVPSWHSEAELELMPTGGVSNSITGPVTGTVIQGHTIHGPIN